MQTATTSLIKGKESTDQDSNYVSLVARAGMVMAVIVALALLGMMSSIFVSDSLNGDAAHINIAGSLRMQSVRLSRALIAQQKNLNNLRVKSLELTEIASEILEFENRLNQLEAGLGQQLENAKVAKSYNSMLQKWLEFKTEIYTSPQQFLYDYTKTDLFVGAIDRFVTTLQQRSEVKLRLLRGIQSVSMFLILLTAFISLLRINKFIVQPMATLVKAASEAGKGNFKTKIDAKANNEIGVLANTFNTMSAQLQSMHDKLEERVREKTNKLKQRNKSLELLYQTSHNLVSPTKDEDYKILLNRVEETLDNGRLMLCLKNTNSQSRLRPISGHKLTNDCDHSNGTCDFCSAPRTRKLSFNIKKNDDDFGFLRYIDDDIAPLKQWQSHLLRAVADNIAVAISLDKKRSQEALLALQEERTVIARELHDSLAQSLSYMKMQTSVLAKQLDRDMSRSRIDETIDDLREGLSDAYRQLRELLTTFRLQVSDASLGSTLNAIAIEFTHKCNHPVTLEYKLVSDTLSPNEKIHLLQIVREALSNIQRHAHASEAKISLSQQKNKLQVSVSDNGIGLPKAKLSGARYGISIMNERADSLGAQLEINQITIGGTEVKFEFVPSSTKPTIANDVDSLATA